MEDFKKFIENIGGVWAIILAGGAFAPVLALFSGLAPAGTLFTGEVLAVLTGLLALFVVLNVWVFGSGLRRHASKVVFGAISLAALTILLSYFYYLSRFQLEWNGAAFIAGCEWTQFALGEAKAEGLVVSATCPGDASFLLADAAQPSEIWTSGSIAATERALYLLWGAFTICWSLLVAFFALAFLNKPHSRPTAASPG